MEEIAPRVYIETSYAGVTVGAVNCPHGLILIDTPFLPEDISSWRSSLLNLGGGVERVLINLDANPDRILGASDMDCAIIGHKLMAQVIRSRPQIFKWHIKETGTDWEMFQNAVKTDWAPPELTFSEQMLIHWGNNPITLEYRPGPSDGSIWVVLAEQGIIFLGDAVVTDQPPFLANADLPTWIETIENLLTRDYRDYLFVSGRGGLINHGYVRSQIKFLKKVKKSLDSLAAREAPAEEVEKLIPSLMKVFKPSSRQIKQFQQRLNYGLFHYYSRTYLPSNK